MPYPSCGGCQNSGWTIAQDFTMFCSHETREAVNGAEVRADRARKEQRRHWEVLSARPSRDSADRGRVHRETMARAGLSSQPPSNSL